MSNAARKTRKRRKHPDMYKKCPIFPEKKYYVWQNATMKHFTFLTALLAASLMTTAQNIEYPYNPDLDNDEFIATSDLTGFLAQFGQNFQPAPVLVDSVDLLEVIQMMQIQITALQNQVATLEAQTVEGLNDYLSVNDSTHTVMVSGANLQVVNGDPAGPTVGFSNAVNGKGNLILGYNVQGVDTVYARTGSHCLVMGRYNDYNSRYSIVHGRGSSTNGNHAVTLAGYNNLTTSDYAATLGGFANENNGLRSVIVGGQGNRVLEGFDGVIVGGGSNENNGLQSVIVGGIGNTLESEGSRAVLIGGNANRIVEGLGSVLVGGEQNSVGVVDSLDSRYSVLAGGRFNELNAGYCGFIGGGYGNILEPDTMFSSPQCRSIVGGSGNHNFGSLGASIIGGWGSELRQRVGFDGRNDLLIGHDSFIGSIQENNALNVRITGELEGEE